jgi:hypothetical protein
MKMPYPCPKSRGRFSARTSASAVLINVPVQAGSPTIIPAQSNGLSTLRSARPRNRIIVHSGEAEAPTMRPGDLWSGQARGWRSWLRRPRRVGRWPWIFAALVGLLVLALIVPPFAEDDAPNPCSALERRVAASLSSAALLRRFGTYGRFGVAAATHRLPYLPPYIGCASGWWHVVLVPSAAPGWFDAMRWTSGSAITPRQAPSR